MAGNNKVVVLGLRATSEQRAWMNEQAKKHGLSLQAYFDRVMEKASASSWQWDDRVRIVISKETEAIHETLEALLSDHPEYGEILVEIAHALARVDRRRRRSK